MVYDYTKRALSLSLCLLILVSLFIGLLPVTPVLASSRASEAPSLDKYTFAETIAGTFNFFFCPTELKSVPGVEPWKNVSNSDSDFMLFLRTVDENYYKAYNDLGFQDTDPNGEKYLKIKRIYYRGYTSEDVLYGHYINNGQYLYSDFPGLYDVLLVAMSNSFKQGYDLINNSDGYTLDALSRLDGVRLYFDEGRCLGLGYSFENRSAPYFYPVPASVNKDNYCYYEYQSGRGFEYINYYYSDDVSKSDFNVSTQYSHIRANFQRPDNVWVSLPSDTAVPPGKNVFSYQYPTITKYKISPLFNSYFGRNNIFKFMVPGSADIWKAFQSFNLKAPAVPITAPSTDKLNSIIVSIAGGSPALPDIDNFVGPNTGSGDTPSGGGGITPGELEDILNQGDYTDANNKVDELNTESDKFSDSFSGLRNILDFELISNLWKSVDFSGFTSSLQLVSNLIVSLWTALGPFGIILNFVLVTGLVAWLLNF